MMPMRVCRTNGNTGQLDPFSALSRWSRDLDRFFDRSVEGASAKFPVDIREEGDHLVIEAELPGVSRDDLDITVENSVLTVKHEKQGEASQEQKQYHLRERWQGSYSRSFRLPETIDSEKVEANLSNGVLTLRFPTREEAKPRKIEVK